MRLLHWFICLIHFMSHCFERTDSLITNSYEQILQWNPQYQSQSKTLNTLQKLHNSSAILHFIELSHNFTADDLDKCKRVSLASLNFTVPEKVYQQFSHQADIALRTSHFLSNLFSSDLHSNISLHHLISSKDFYWALLLANLQSNLLIFGAGISFSNIFLSNFLLNLKHFSPYLYRNVRANESIKLNLAANFKRFSNVGATEPETFKSEWFWNLAVPEYSAIVSQWKNMNADSLDNIKGVWSSPYLDCGLTKTWLSSYIVPFFRINNVNSVNDTTLV